MSITLNLWCKSINAALFPLGISVHEHLLLLCNLHIIEKRKRKQKEDEGREGIEQGTTEANLGILLVMRMTAHYRLPMGT